MGKSSSTEGELSSILHAPGKSCKEDISPPSQMIDSSNPENGSNALGKSCKEDISPPSQMIDSSNCENGSNAPGKSFKEDISPPSQMIDSSNRENGSSLDAGASVRIGTVENISPSKNFAPCFENQICNNKRDQTFCSVDCEAALPPSKRLHRALEAMSANAAEEGQARIESSASRMTSIGTCCIATGALKTCLNMTINDHEGGGLELQKFNTCDGDSSHIIVPSLPANSNQVDKLSTRFQPQETGKDVLPGAADKVEELGDFVACHTANVDLDVQVHREISPNLYSKCCEVEGNPRNMMFSSDFMLNMGARPKKGGKLLKENTHSNKDDNWSTSQKQLVYLGSVLLKKSKILVLDEITAFSVPALKN